MAMWIDVTLADGTSIYLRAPGGYNPDVMTDLKNRCAALMVHAASINLQVIQALDAMGITADDVAELEDDGEVPDDETEAAA